MELYDEWYNLKEEITKEEISEEEISELVVEYKAGNKTDKEFIDFFINLTDNKSLCHKVNLGQRLVNVGIGLEDTTNPDTE